MKNATHRVVIIKNFNSAIISQAIIFLKDTASESEPGILAEAEKIVEKYMSEGNIPGIVAPKKKPHKKNIMTCLTAGIILLGILSAIIVRL